MKYVSPSSKETAFNCSHCGALARQHWYSTHADPIGKDELPLVIDAAKLEGLNLDHIEDNDERDRWRKWAERKAIGRPFFQDESRYCDVYVHNVWFSHCFNCNEIAVWLCDRMIYPQRGEAPLANEDLPAEIARDYEEASSILDLSPRGAAALIRLAIQKLCKHLGQTGKNINNDIKALVQEGLDPRVQKALDSVRVIGNNAVHPGQVDLHDNRETAESLFKLLNLIAEKMISEPKHVDEVYASLPETARAEIMRRDGKSE
ncbi:DUF4145 domain-containing protein [Pyruvatibacter mobilis]|uniref:DUF4145 domain-containing protein n=1 Tax=Pyruvatibacter mobilis TaxID=1712261 RepID=UPI003BAD5275